MGCTVKYIPRAFADCNWDLQLRPFPGAADADSILPVVILAPSDVHAPDGYFTNKYSYLFGYFPLPSSIRACYTSKQSAATADIVH